MEENEKKYIDDTREYWAGFPEAPASDSFKWVDARGFEHLTTIRAYSPHLLFTQIEKTTAGILDIGGTPINNQPKPAPVAQIAERDETGTPVIDGQTGQPVMIPLPAGTKLYTVTGLFHDKTKNGKDVLKVITAEEPYNRKFGVSCWHGGPSGWNAWPLGVDNKYAPPEGFKQVIIRDPEGEGKYPEVVEFR